MRILFTLIFLVSLAGAEAHVDSMKVYWPFYGSTYDWSGWNNNGVNYGAQLTRDRNGAPDHAYSFDGTDYMTFSTKNIFTEEYAYAFWTRLDAVPTAEQTAIRVAGDSCEQFISFYADTTGGIGLRYYTQQENSLRDIKIPGKVPVDQWTHIAVLNSPDSLEVYINLVKVYGEEIKDKPCYGQQPGVGYFGAYDSMSGHFEGDLDELRIYVESIPGSELFDAYIQEKLGVNEIDKFEIDVYPNPSANGKFLLRSEEEIVAIRVNDISGRSVDFNSRKEGDHWKLALPEASGVYLLQVFSDRGIVSRRIIVN